MEMAVRMTSIGLAVFGARLDEIDDAARAVRARRADLRMKSSSSCAIRQLAFPEEVDDFLVS